MSRSAVKLDAAEVRRYMLNILRRRAAADPSEYLTEDDVIDSFVAVLRDRDAIRREFRRLVDGGEVERVMRLFRARPAGECDALIEEHARHVR